VRLSRIKLIAPSPTQQVTFKFAFANHVSNLSNILPVHRVDERIDVASVVFGATGRVGGYPGLRTHLVSDTSVSHTGMSSRSVSHWQLFSMKARVSQYPSPSTFEALRMSVPVGNVTAVVSFLMRRAHPPVFFLPGIAAPNFAVVIHTATSFRT